MDFYELLMLWEDRKRIISNLLFKINVIVQNMFCTMRINSNKRHNLSNRLSCYARNTNVLFVNCNNILFVVCIPSWQVSILRNHTQMCEHKNLSRQYPISSEFRIDWTEAFLNNRNSYVVVKNIQILFKILKGHCE